MNLIHIIPQPCQTLNETLVRSCTIRNLFGDAEIQLWFELPRSISIPDDNDCDSYLLCIIMDAMKQGKKIHVQGSVSALLLSNLVEFQSAWQKWLPHTYAQVEITVESLREKETFGVKGAMCAFSGGVDATFSLWRHYAKLWGHRSQTIKLAAMVHGFDIPLKSENEFANAFRNAQSTLNDLDIPLIPLKTNYREFSKVQWEHVFSCALVAALGNLKSMADVCLVGSGQPYDALVFPWGSNPITDPLMSSDDVSVIYDGASHSRTEKVKTILDWEKGVQNLRVCWQGDAKDSNCGHCEKCVRTKLNFLAVGAEIPTCFPTSDICEDIKRITLNNAAQRGEWKQLIDYASKQGISAEWMLLAKALLKKKSFQEILLPENSRRKNFLRKLLGK